MKISIDDIIKVVESIKQLQAENKQDEAIILQLIKDMQYNGGFKEKSPEEVFEALKQKYANEQHFI